MNEFTSRQLQEIEHNKKILNQANKIWGRESLIGEMRMERRAKIFIELAKLTEEKNVLEIGCGTGELTYYLVRSKAKILATDIFQDFLEITKNKVNFPNVKFQNASGENLENLPSNYFDLVCGTSILHHLEIEPALESIYQVLKPEGLMIFSEPNMLNPQIILQKNIPIIKKWLGDSPSETAFFSWQIKFLLKKKNFKNISIKPFDFTHPFLPDFFAGVAKNISYFLEHLPLIKEFAGSLLIVAQKPTQ